MVLVEGNSTSSAMLHSRKRKLPVYDVSHDPDYFAAKRLSPFTNTPKQRKEERRNILKITAKKLKAIEDPEKFLRRSVLVNNQYRRLRKEMIDEKKYGYSSSGPVSHYETSVIVKAPAMPVQVSPVTEANIKCDTKSDHANNHLPYITGLPNLTCVDDPREISDIKDTVNHEPEITEVKDTVNHEMIITDVKDIVNHASVITGVKETVNPEPVITGIKDYRENMEVDEHISDSNSGEFISSCRMSKVLDLSLKESSCDCTQETTSMNRVDDSQIDTGCDIADEEYTIKDISQNNSDIVMKSSIKNEHSHSTLVDTLNSNNRKAAESSSNCSEQLTERDRQILSGIDEIFNKLYNVLAEVDSDLDKHSALVAEVQVC